MITLRKSEERGHFNHGWLNTYHTFSFADYYDPRFVGFRNLRVINEDRVAPGEGFPTHPHRDMEIISYVLDGALAHNDSMGNGSVIRPGDVQRMSAGRGVRHSEYNPNKGEPAHFLQIWITPGERGIEPGYEQKLFSPEDKLGKLKLVASPDGSDNSVTIHQDVRLYASLLEKGQEVEAQLGPARYGWVQVARGAATLNGQTLNQGDGAAVGAGELVKIAGADEGRSEVLFFDLA
jgi:redox-sensitive bicupin YhaK (pirin superfamily)